MYSTIAAEELLWAGLGIISLYYMIPVYLRARARLDALIRSGGNGQSGILLHGDVAIGGALIAVQILLTVPGVLQLFRENPPFSVARMVTIGFLIAAQALILYIARRRARMYEDFYGYEDDPARAVTAAQHAETMGELCHNTAITTTAAGAATAAHAAASEARSEANAAQTSATAARGEAEVAKAEATAAHRGAQEILERIDEATRGTGERAGR